MNLWCKLNRLIMSQRQWKNAIFFESRVLKDIQYHVLNSQLVNFALVNQTRPDFNLADLLLDLVFFYLSLCNTMKHTRQYSCGRRHTRRAEVIVVERRAGPWGALTEVWFVLACHHQPATAAADTFGPIGLLLKSMLQQLEREERGPSWAIDNKLTIPSRVGLFGA